MKKLLTVLLIIMLCTAVLFAEDNVEAKKERFRLEAGASASLSSNIGVTSLPFIDAVVKASFLNNHVGIVGGAEFYNDIWLVDGASTFQRLNYVVGLELFRNRITIGLNPFDAGDTYLSSIRYSYNWKLLEEKKNHMLYGVDLRLGLDMAPSVPKTDDPVLAVFSALFTIIIPRVSVGGVVRVGTAY